MNFEWDPNKNKSNFHKHKISFKEAINIFDSPIITQVDTRKNYGEKRYISIGTLGGSAIILVVHTSRNNNIRIISARIAKKKERRYYHENIQKKA